MKVLVGVAVAVIAVITVSALTLASVLLIDGRAQAVTGTDGGGGLRGVPAEFRPWILKADAACPEAEMTPALLASQLWAESKFKTSRKEATSGAGAQGPAQFIPGTWATWGVDADGNGEASPWDIGDAVMAQGRMMCSLLKQAKASGYGGDPRALALAGYNAGWGAVEQYRGVPPKSFARGETYGYVVEILADLPRFQGPGLLEISGSGTGPDALRKASTRAGTPTPGEAADPRVPARDSATASTDTSTGSAPRASPSDSTAARSSSTRTGPKQNFPGSPPNSTAPPPTARSPAMPSSPATCCSGRTAARARSTTSRCTRVTVTSCTPRARAASSSSSPSTAPCPRATTSAPPAPDRPERRRGNRGPAVRASCGRYRRPGR